MLSASTRVLFYLTPVLYPLSIVPEEWRGIYMLNPMVGVIELHRSLLLDGTLPPLDVLVVSIVVTAVVLVIGAAVFARRQVDFEDYV
jgi:ABC-type polysaccharide/polyol phosphate export permease